MIRSRFSRFARVRVGLCMTFVAICGMTNEPAARAADAPKRPNFLIILGDNLGRDWFGCYGSDEGVTPNIDRLARTGVLFPTCYVTPLCSTTRAELWTGRYGLHTGWHTHHDTAIYGGGYFDWNREITLARVLQSAGYATALAGKWQINDLYEQTDALKRHGFDEHVVWTGALIGEGTAEPRWKASLINGRVFESRYWDPLLFRDGKRVEEKGAFGPDVDREFLVDFMKRHKDEPFFAFYSCRLTHVPTVPTPLSPNPETPEREQFAGMVRYFDHQVGQLTSALEELGLRDDTIVIITTDNGTSRKYSGVVRGVEAQGGLGTLSENGLDVPLVVNCPGRVPEGVVSQALVDCSDFFPTVVELAGAELPTDRAIDGHSFARELGDGDSSAEPRDWVFTQYAGTRVVRDRRYKFYSTGKLFDITADPLEKNDLATSDDAGVAAARERLRKVLDGLPPDEKLPFEPRSSSAFRMREKAK